MKRWLASSVLLMSSSAFSAGITGYAKLASNYIWRGISFTENNPAIQLSANYEHSSGLWGNIFGSNLKFAEPTLYEGDSTREMDLTLGYKKALGDIAANFYVNRYEFIDRSQISAFEYSTSFSYKNVTFEYNYLPNWFGYNSVSHYLRLSGFYDIDAKYSLIGGFGRNEQSKTQRTQNAEGTWSGVGFTSYWDYYAGLQVKDGVFTYEFLYTNTNRKTISYATGNPAEDGQYARANDESLTVSLTKFF
ncbi:TorF family putative porin [Peredibacter sp. HCB2-198]|uniref:TorF family putative porin n=1 Tax=Peredibacter sp. HCB2-198 TaxID=3383025 RepID=UPI0038B48516